MRWLVDTHVFEVGSKATLTLVDREADGLALLTIVAGVLLCITIIGIPLGLAAFKMLPIVFSPFGHVIVDADSPDAAMGVAIGR